MAPMDMNLPQDNPATERSVMAFMAGLCYRAGSSAMADFCLAALVADVTRAFTTQSKDPS